MNETAHGSGARELKVLTTVALKGVLDELAPDFTRTTGCSLSCTYGPGGMVAERLKSGMTPDVAVTTPAMMETLIRDGYIVAGSAAPIGRSIIGVAVRAGAPKPKIGTVDEFRQALLAAKSVAYTDPATGAASGVHMVKILERLGIAEAVNAKAKLGSGGPVAEFLARGEAELAVQQICEHMLVEGVEVVGPLPPELQSVTTLAIGLHQRAAAPEAGLALIELLISPVGQRILPAHGLQPPA
ncbi:MAG TPA: substrate-binding domain-containing protein [Xanthobacteraceae bacterium]|nr:substrate-binding domain-containing protein [Xanthobacteraceae bacterium]